MGHMAGKTPPLLVSTLSWGISHCGSQKRMNATGAWRSLRVLDEGSAPPLRTATCRVRACIALDAARALGTLNTRFCAGNEYQSGVQAVQGRCRRDYGIGG
jgi:hypothetical protein